MNRRVFQIISSIILILLISINGRTIHGYLHLFTGHTDTEHVCNNDLPQFEDEHHHCDYADLILPSFLCLSISEIEFYPPQFDKEYIVTYTFTFESRHLSKLSRGPPTV